MEFFALIVIAVLIAAAIAIVVVLGNLPGKLARAADHPQADAIALLGWLGLLFGIVGWAAALVWARTRPLTDAALQARVAELEARLAEQSAEAEAAEVSA